MKTQILTMAIALTSFPVCLSGATRESRLDELESISRFIPSDDLTEVEEFPSPLEVKNKYCLTYEDFIEDLVALSQKYSADETNESNRICRNMSYLWIGEFGNTNNLGYLSTIMTNNLDYAQESALLAGFNILKHEAGLIPFVRNAITNSCVYSSGTRRLLKIRLNDLCSEGASDNYIDDPEQHARIAAFSLEVASFDREEPLGADDFACRLNPSYRHSQQRRDNLAALRPPGLIGRPAELYDAAQADAARDE